MGCALARVHAGEILVELGFGAFPLLSPPVSRDRVQFLLSYDVKLNYGSGFLASCLASRVT